MAIDLCQKRQEVPTAEGHLHHLLSARSSRMSVDDLDGVRNAEGEDIEIEHGAVVVGGDGEGGVAVEGDDPHLLVVAGPGDCPFVGEVPVSVDLKLGFHDLGYELEPLTVPAERFGHGRGEDGLRRGSVRGTSA